MKKSKRIISLSIIAIIGLFCATEVFAGYGLFQFNIPRMQSWDVSDNNNGNGYITNSSNHGNVYLEGIRGVDSVSFYAGAWTNNGNDSITWASNGGTISASDFNNGEGDAEIPYERIYGAGQKMGLKVRNHRWELSTGSVSGTVDYH